MKSCVQGTREKKRVKTLLKLRDPLERFTNAREKYAQTLSFACIYVFALTFIKTKKPRKTPRKSESTKTSVPTHKVDAWLVGQ